MKVDDNEGNQESCRAFCGKCPSYPRSDEWLFCARGKSREKISRNGCLCNSCPVYKKYDLSGFYFCDKEALE
jgi:hypothetical protein